MLSLMRLLRRLARDERGSTAIEYALIAVICSICIVAALYTTRDTLVDMYNQASEALGTNSN